jgi:hypothetical protein
MHVRASALLWLAVIVSPALAEPFPAYKTDEYCRASTATAAPQHEYGA